ncbi:heme-degrading domain-containing protein [Rhizobium sp. SSA_523]|uniref:heme-degrading domain-containing protein n=1 Tax=Rhizobium sp. SSA_523 TaxID=2952477 RepID=UPI0020908300|nr:heme-degrading domain-containing protein [Rhizobium sp. SSA_523]MCO5730210.1 heme-degrading domain-containing protein [Rhizobium sp. SSA_523]WKC25270.1 heme-degrading domain-containing protein [Rhizobium sp. SSA_523]
MSTKDDIRRVSAQESALRFEKFDLDSAWTLGQHIRSLAASAHLVLSVDIHLNGSQAFFAAMPGAKPDFEHWIRRKRNLTLRMLRSSYGLGLDLLEQKTTLDAKWGLASTDYAAHGGSFPIHVHGVGCVGAVTVSGLPQREDHNLVVEALAVHLGLDPHQHRLA